MKARYLPPPVSRYRTVSPFALLYSANLSAKTREKKRNGKREEEVTSAEGGRGGGGGGGAYNRPRTQRADRQAATRAEIDLTVIAGHRYPTRAVILVIDER